MNKKRAERQAKWRSEQDERRTQEYQPFTPPTQVIVLFKTQFNSLSSKSYPLVMKAFLTTCSVPWFQLPRTSLHSL